jgi:hypothetical protein
VSNCAVDRASQLCGSNSLAPEPIIVSATTHPNDQISGANLRVDGRMVNARVIGGPIMPGASKVGADTVCFAEYKHGGPQGQTQQHKRTPASRAAPQGRHKRPCLALHLRLDFRSEPHV